nr:protein-lysine n-methyltransferase rrg1 [Quercus suber]
MTDRKAEDLSWKVDDEETLDVLDLPQLYAKPSAKAILATLSDLSSEPPSWDATPRSATPRSPLSGISTPLKRRRKVRSEGVPGYLTKIISSPLTWIDNEGEKELIWESASQRLSERSGRTGMGAMSRTFTIPLVMMSDGTSTTDETQLLDVVLHEPALTADNLGLKTWGSSYLLAKRLVLLQDKLLAANKVTSAENRILELGAGTGLVGIAAAFILQQDALLTDLPAIVPNLERNARENTLLAARPHGNVEVGVLDWSKPTSLIMSGSPIEERVENSFPVILAADPLYDVEHASLLPNAIAMLLSKDRDARVVIELPLREAYAAERKLLRQNMEAAGLAIEDENEEVGFDDWGASNAEERAEVTCWWSVWRWR